MLWYHCRKLRSVSFFYSGLQSLLPRSYSFFTSNIKDIQAMATGGIGGDISEPDDRSRLRQHFLEKNTPQKWDELWKDGSFLPWDRGTPNPALVDVLSTKKDVLGNTVMVEQDGKKRRKKALVPGCGKGYDVYLFAAFGYDAYGLEGSKHAIEACEGFRGVANTKEEYEARDQEAGKGEVTFLYGDFFSREWEKGAGEGGFDVIYDYTVRISLPLPV
jgi:SAM-dependent methyltransferase